ncbi:MAG: ABC transporter ATP-binding protein [Verrucomicrobia bacterium]|nr:ABC transporter ATP-binding protein [Verrucomicrobiota bacterium]
MNQLRRVLAFGLPFLWPYRNRFLAGVALALFFGLTNGAFVLATKTLFERLSPSPVSAGQVDPQSVTNRVSEEFADFMESVLPRSGQPITPLQAAGAVLFLPLLMALRAGSNYLSAYSMTWVSARVVRDMQLRVLEKLHSLSLDYFSKSTLGDLTTHISGDTRRIFDAMNNGFADLIKEPFTLVSILAGMFIIDARLTLAAMVILPLVILPILVVGNRLKRLGAFRHPADQGLRLGEVPAGSLPRGKHGSGEPRGEKGAGGKTRQSGDRGGQHTWSGRPDSGGLRHPSVGFGFCRLSHWHGHAAQSGQTVGPNACRPGLRHGELRAPGKVFCPNSLRARAGRSSPDRPAAKGTGLGKGLSGLRPRPCSPGCRPSYSQGLQAWLGRPQRIGKKQPDQSPAALLRPHPREDSLGRPRDFSTAELRREMALVSQDVILFDASVADNIALGRDGATQAEIEEAARQAFADHFIRNLPRGYQTRVGERGVLLSGGQKARISLARAFLRNAPILILDEATAALDAEAETEVQKAIDRLEEGRTVVCIAHRLATLANMDEIAVLEGGKVVERGSYGQLLSQGGLFSRMAAQQGLA